MEVFKKRDRELWNDNQFRKEDDGTFLDILILS